MFYHCSSKLSLLFLLCSSRFLSTYLLTALLVQRHVLASDGDGRTVVLQLREGSEEGQFAA